MVLKQARFRPKTEQSFGRRVKLHDSQTCTITSSASSWVWRSVKLHGTQTHATLSSQNTLGSGRNCRILKQGCRRFCFVIIIPYPDRKANICSIRLRAEKGEVQDVLHRECRYSLIKNDKNDYVRTKKQNLRNKKENVYDLLG